MCETLKEKINSHTVHRTSRRRKDMEKIVLDCQKCGGTLEITPEIEIFKCKYCDTPYLVKRNAGSIQITKLEERIEIVENKQISQSKDMYFFEIKNLHGDIEVIISKVKEARKKALFTYDKFYKSQGLEEKLERVVALTKKYINLGGNDSEILNYGNPYEFLIPLKNKFPAEKYSYIFHSEKKFVIIISHISIDFNYPKKLIKIQGKKKHVTKTITGIIKTVMIERYPDFTFTHWKEPMWLQILMVLFLICFCLIALFSVLSNL